MTCTIIIEPTEHMCVETMARKMYWSMVDEYLSMGVEDREIEEKIELLRIFLEESDVGKFRSEVEEYMQKGHSPFLLLVKDDLGKINVEIKVK